MKRKRIAIFATLLASLTLICLLTGVGLRSVQAAALSQEEPAEQQVLTQPVRITLQQRIPITLNMVTTQAITTSESPTRPINQLVTQTIVLLLNVNTRFDVTSTGTTTVPSPLIFDFATLPTGTLPAALFWDVLSNGNADLAVELRELEVAPAEEITAAESVTDTTPITESAAVTDSTSTETEETAANPLNATTTVTANVRDGTSLESQIVTQLAPGTAIQLVAQSEDQNWLLLASGYWVSVLVVDAIPANLPTASAEQVTTLRAAGRPITGTFTLPATPEVVVEPTPIAPTPVETATVTITESLPTTIAVPAATPTSAPISPTIATTITIVTGGGTNLRSGPGTEYGLLGQTTEGQQFVANGRNQDNTWLHLENNVWVFAQLVALGGASTDSLPELNPDGTPVQPPTPIVSPTPALPTPTVSVQATGTTTSTQTTLPTPTPRSGNNTTLPTATPRASTVSATATPTATTATTTQTISSRSTVTPTSAAATSPSKADEDYLAAAEQIANDYGTILTAIELLVSQANEDNAQLTAAKWITDMRTQIAGLRQQGERARRLIPPDRFATAHVELVSASASFDSAATLFTAAVQNANTAQFDQAYAQLNLGEDSLTQLQKGLAEISGE